MLIYVDGNLFDSPAKVLVNTVNTVGVMGKGIAKSFKFFFPEMFKEYQDRCEKNLFGIGKLYLFKGSNKWVLNFPTKQHWRNPSKPEYIEAGLKAFCGGYARNGITSIAFPRLGCGNGELDWERQVRPMMEKYLAKLPIEVFVHHFTSAPIRPEHQDIESTKKWLRSVPECLGFEEVWSDILATRERRQTGAPSTIEFDPVTIPDLGLRFSVPLNFFVSKSALLEAWQNVRSSGFLSASSLVEGLDEYADQIMQLFAQLPYVRTTNIAQFRLGEPQLFHRAIQFLPRVTLTDDCVDFQTARSL